MSVFVLQKNRCTHIFSVLSPEYYCHIWAGARHDNSIQNIASLSLFCRYYFGGCSSELAQLVPFPYSQGRSTHYSDRLHDFSVTTPRCYKDVYLNSFFPHTARLWNYFFPLTYDLNGFSLELTDIF